MSLEACLLVLFGGFLGGVARHFVTGFVGQRVGALFPWGTLLVNVSGALLIGLLAGLARAVGGTFAAPSFQEFAFVGLCGGYTTVSSFSLQTLKLGFEGASGRATAYVAMSAGLCVLAVAVGFWSVVALNS